MQKKKIGVITFAITLISLGVLLLMKNFADIDLKTTFAIVWPSIIILFGVEIIVTKIMLSRKSEDIKFYIDPLSIILLSIIIVIASIYSSFSFSNDFGLFSIIKSFDLRDLSGITSSYIDESTYNYTFNIDAENKEEFQIISSFGNIEITENTGKNIEIVAEIKIKYNDRAYADELSKSIVKIDELGSNIRVLSDLDSSKYNKNRAGDISVNYNIHVPGHIKANVENKFGNTTIKNMKKDVDIKNQHGNIEVIEITGPIKLKNSFGNIVVENITGSVELDCAHGNVEVENVSDSLVILNSFGTVKVSDVKGYVDIDNQHDSVYVDNAENNVKIKNKFGEIDVKTVKGNLNIENENGDIYIENIMGDILSYDKFGNTDIKNANKFTKIISKNGDISYKTNELIEEGVEIDNEFGDIKISVPSKQKGSFNIVAEFGEIKNKLGLNVMEGITEQSVNEFIDNSNVKFYIRSRNGDIDLNTN